jgi:hypothetical protein
MVSDPDTGRAAAAWVLLGATALVGASAWYGQYLDVHRMGEAEALSPLIAAVLEGWEPGDAIRTLPVWDDRLRLGLDDRPFLTTMAWDSWEEHRFQRVWLLSSDSHRSQAVDEARLHLREPVEIGRVPGFLLQRGELASSQSVVFDGWVELDRARVTQRQWDGPPVVCDQWDGQRWDCGTRDDFVHVVRAYRHMDEDVRTCIALVPPGDQRVWSLHWEDVPLDGMLRLRAGNTLWGVRHDRGSEVLVRVLADQREVLSHRFAPQGAGYPEMVAMLSVLGVERGSLTLEVSATDPVDRFFCLRPQIVR